MEGSNPVSDAVHCGQVPSVGLPVAVTRDTSDGRLHFHVGPSYTLHSFTWIFLGREIRHSNNKTEPVVRHHTILFEINLFRCAVFRAFAFKQNLSVLHKALLNFPAREAWIPTQISLKLPDIGLGFYQSDIPKAFDGEEADGVMTIGIKRENRGV